MSRKVPENSLTPKQARYLAYLLEGYTKESAAKAVGTTPRRARQWHHNPAFQQALSEAVDSLLRTALLELAGTLEDALSALRSALHDGTPAQRASAAERLISILLKLRTDFDLSTRIERLEKEVPYE